jgi:serine/threonine-protein kinase
MSNALKIVKDINEYHFVREIARGGMGVVYEAKRMGAEGFAKTMAIKTILGDFTTNHEFIDMFIGEAKLVADLVHENIVQIYDLGFDGEMYYIALEYINGYNLEQFINAHIQNGKAIPVELVSFIISRVCRALEYAHNKRDPQGQLLGIVHRDVSPRNIMMTKEGVVKLTDFGIAKAARIMSNREGEILMGKIEYMSPEQADYKETDRRSDIFSIGVVFFELLAGKPLFEKSQNTFVALQNVAEKPIPDIRTIKPGIPEPLINVLNKALQRDLDKRYQSAGEMCHDLEYFMYHDRFGPTNPTLALYLADLFHDTTPYYHNLTQEKTVVSKSFAK